MANLFDRVQETTTTIGTGSYALAGATPRHIAFSAVVPTLDTLQVHYFVEDSGTDFELGIGTYNSGLNQLSRDTIVLSSNANAAVSWAAGTKTIWLNAPAASMVNVIGNARSDAGNTEGVTIASGAAANGQSGDLLITSGAAAGAGQNTGGIEVTTGVAADGVSGAISLQTSDAVGANRGTGYIAFTTGTPTGTGVAGQLDISIGGVLKVRITSDGDVEFKGSTITQNSQSADYTTVIDDANKHILHPSADTTARTFTIDSNANVPYRIGTAIAFVNQDSAGTLTIAIASDTMRFASSGATGSRTLAANGVATALKITATEWIISGTGLT